LQGNLGVERSETLNRPFDFCEILGGRFVNRPYEECCGVRPQTKKEALASF
jgi:hypothetical protein